MEHVDNFKFVEVIMKNTNKLIGCCGVDCDTCDARIATITNDNALREKNCCPVDKAQWGNNHTGNDKLHRLPHRGRKNALLRQALPRT